MRVRFEILFFAFLLFLPFWCISNIIESASAGVKINYLYKTEETPLQYIVIEDILLDGNTITKSHIIKRELLFNEGDTISVSEFEKVLAGSRENLLNTSLFNFVEFTANLHPNNGSTINILFVERWYLWPFPTLDIHERNINSWMESPDFARVSYGFYLVFENFRGRKERLRFNLRAGYNQRYAFSYTIPYINNKQTIGMSLSAGYVRAKEINFITIDNKQIFFKNPLDFVRTDIYAQANFTYRKNFYHTHKLNVRYNNVDFADTVQLLNPLFINSDNSHIQYFTLKYEYISDFRDLKAYPLNGYFNKLSVTQHGFNIFNNDITPLLAVENSYRRYLALSPRWFFAAGINTKISFSEKYPYFIERGLGFNDNFVRGYENYIVDAQHFGVLKTNLKYNILPQRVKRISFITNEKFGLMHYAIFINAFADIGYAYDNVFFDRNPYSNEFLGGVGLGVDFVTYYDKVFRTEFTINRHGKPGLYFHIVAPI